MKKEKIPMGNAPLGPLKPPPKASNVLIFPSDRINRDLTATDTKVIYVDFQNRKKLGHIA